MRLDLKRENHEGLRGLGLYVHAYACVRVCVCVCVWSLLWYKEVKSNLKLMKAVLCPFNPNQLATGPHTPIKVNGRENSSANHREINRNTITCLSAFNNHCLITDR